MLEKATSQISPDKSYWQISAESETRPAKQTQYNKADEDRMND
jgi:hypothetical protein